MMVAWSKKQNLWFLSTKQAAFEKRITTLQGRKDLLKQSSSDTRSGRISDAKEALSGMLEYSLLLKQSGSESEVVLELGRKQSKTSWQPLLLKECVVG